MTQVWVNSGSWWWTGRPGVLQSMGSQRVGHDWATELTRSVYLRRCKVSLGTDPFQLLPTPPFLKKTGCCAGRPSGLGLVADLTLSSVSSLAWWPQKWLYAPGCGDPGQTARALLPQALLSNGCPVWCGSPRVVTDASVGILGWLRWLKRAVLSTQPSWAMGVFSSLLGTVRY